MKRVLITGGAGFLGSHLTRALLERGVAVRVLDSFVASSRDCVSPEAEVIAGDIRDRSAVERAIEGMDRIVHLAAVSSVEQSERDQTNAQDVNRAGTERVMDAASHARPGPVPVVYASSAAVYAAKPEGRQCEQDDPAPTSAYGASKLANEGYAARCWKAHSLASVGLRIFNAYGPSLGPSGYEGVVARFGRSMKAGRAIEIQGSGAQSRDFVYVDDVVRAMLLALESPVDARVYNVCSGVETSIRQLAVTAAAISGAVLRLEHVAPREIDIIRSVGCPDRAAEELGFSAAVSLQDGLRATLKAPSQRS